jgi:ectoine hydroxylase-related dioxygenase (phytanoyl-CoA dioxygenase family)
MSRTFSNAELDNLTEELNRDGICILKNMLDPELIDEWAEAYHSLYEKRRAREGGVGPRGDNRYYLTFPFKAPFADPGVFAHPALLGVLDRTFAQEYVMVQLAADTPFPGSQFQIVHRDYRPLFTDDFYTPLYALAVNFPLVDVDEDRAPFQMARGTHRMPKDEALAKIESGEIPMETFLMERGDVMIRTPLALHRGTPNRSQVARPMVVMGYVMHWLHTAKVDLQVDRNTFSKLPVKLQKMLRCQIVEELPDFKPETYIDFTY